MRPREIGRDFAWGAASAVLVWLIIEVAGGIWGHIGGRDLHGFFLPRFEEAARRLIGAGELPLWNPNEFTGNPRFAALQGMVLYPPVPILFALLPRFLALQALYAVNLLVLGWGTVAYLRRHGVARPAALLAVLVAVLGCFSSWSRVGMDHPNFLASVAWVPWIALAWENAVTHGSRPWLGWMAMAVLVQCLAGYLEFPLVTAVLLGAMALVPAQRTLVRRLACLVGGFGLGALLAAIQLLPLLEAVGESQRVAEVGTYESLRAFYGLVSSGLLGRLFYLRFPPPVLALAAGALLVPRRAHLAWLVALLWSLLAMDPPFSALYMLPPFSGFRNALAWTHVTGVFLGWLAAAGLGALAVHRWGMARAAAAALGLLAVLWCGQGIFHAPRDMPMRLPDYPLLEERVRQIARARAARDPEARLVSRHEIDSGSTVRHDLPTPEGYDPAMPPRRILRLMDHIAARGGGEPGRMLRFQADPRLAELLGVGFVALHRDRAAEIEALDFERITALPGDDVLLYRPPVPRVRLVHEVVAAADDGDAFARTVDPARDLRRSAVVEGGVAEVAPLDASGREDVVVVREAPEEIVVATETVSTGLLVLTDTWFPGWEVHVDGVARALLRADYAFRAVVVPAGRHEVTFRYRPGSLRLGAGVSFVALVAALALILSRRRPLTPGVSPDEAGRARV